MTEVPYVIRPHTPQDSQRVMGEVKVDGVMVPVYACGMSKPHQFCPGCNGLCWYAEGPHVGDAWADEMHKEMLAIPDA